MTAYNELSPENGSFASVAPRAFTDMSASTSLLRRQDHTSLPYASPVYAKRLRRAWCRSSRHISVHRDPPNVVTLANAPLSRTGWRQICHCSRFCKNEIFFILGLDIFP